jgi:hypothetical protein
MCWIYRKIRDGNKWLYVVGYYVSIVDPESTLRQNWEPIEDCKSEWEARRLVNFLNGGSTLVSNP